MTDLVNNPPHYKSIPARCDCGSQIECIQITEYMNFNLGNAMKYIWRAGAKTPDATTDLEKAVWYLRREIVRIKGDAP